MTFMMACLVCGEVAKPLPNWKPDEHKNADGSTTIEGTPCYCACNRPEPPTHPSPGTP